MSSFPNWSSFTPAAVEAELPRLLEQAEKGVAALEASEPQTFEDFVWALDDATRELWRCWGGVSHELGVMNSPEWRQVEEKWQGRLVEFSLRVGQSTRLYAHARRVRVALPPTEATRRRILDKSIQGAELAGVALEGENKVRFNEIQTRLAKLAADFHNAVLDATTPEIADAAYLESMKHERDRATRERLYRARATRAPENAARIDEILALRREKAAILGFADFAEFSLATKCAPSVAAILKMVDELDAATADKAAAEQRELKALGLTPSLEPWDVTFAAERLRERRYDYSEDELKRHFELEDVLKGLFRIVKFLFAVDVAEVPAEERPPTWHPDVRFFEVKEGNRTIAGFYFDPYVRTGLKSGGAWMNEFRNRNDRLGELPLATVVTNFNRPDADGRCLLPFREVETLFHEFGHALQCMLTRIGEEAAAGVNLVEWDAVEVASQFMENWCLDDRTGIAVPPDLKAKVRAAKNFRAATACRRQLAFTKTDLELHAAGFAGGAATPDDIKRTNFAHFGVPTVSGDLFLCAFSHIFAGGYAAGYYGYKWAEVMSADCYGAFEEAGLEDDEAVREIGRRYRETVLALGGSKSALDVFREFRGRDPEIAALLRQQELSGDQNRQFVV